MTIEMYILIDEAGLAKLVAAEMSDRLGVAVSASDVTIEVKSKQNYKAEWEKAEFRATIRKLA